MKTWKSLLKFAFLLGSIVALFVSCEPTTYDTFGTICGKVTDVITSNPIPQAYVVLSPGGKTFNTSNNGYFEFPELEPKQYTVTVQKNGYKTNRKSITVVVGERVEANLTLHKNN